MAYQQGHIPSHVGKQIAEEPIRSLDDIASIKAALSNHPRNFALFVVGINTAFRAGDLSAIKVGQVRGLKAGDDVVIREEKTSKTRRITLNDQSASAIEKLLAERPKANGDEFLFVGQRGQMTVSFINRMVKSWCADAGLDGQYGSHSLRKTWGYHQYETFKVRIEVIMQALNHSSPRQTLQYICIQDDTMREVYSNSL